MGFLLLCRDAVGVFYSLLADWDEYFLWYTDDIHIEYIDFSSIHFFLLIIPYFNITECVLITLISKIVLYRDFSFLKKIFFYWKEEKSTFSYF